MSILLVGTTPAVNRILWFDRVTLGAVNRSRRQQTAPTGKAVNAARVLTRLGGECRLLQVLGGETGRYAVAGLEKEGIEHTTLWMSDEAPTRICTTLLAPLQETTELVEEAAPMSAEEVDSLMGLVEHHLTAASALMLSGSCPVGVPDTFYAQLTAAARETGKPVFIDAQGASLRQALKVRPFLVKPNLEESAAALGFPLTGDREADAQTAVTRLTEAGAEWALVSMGEAGALLGNRSNAFWRIASPKLTAVNPIGSGDSLAAGLTLAYLRGSSVPDAAVYGTACAAANCLTVIPGDVSPAEVERLLPQVQSRSEVQAESGPEGS